MGTIPLPGGDEIVGRGIHHQHAQTAVKPSAAALAKAGWNIGETLLEKIFADGGIRGMAASHADICGENALHQGVAGQITGRRIRDHHQRSIAHRGTESVISRML